MRLLTCEEKLAGMVDITAKPPLFRTATASGTIRLRESTIKAITAGQVKKGDVLTTARLAAILAVKDTPRLIPLCHPIPITGLDVNFDLEEERVRATVTVTSVGKTGVEMEALTGVGCSAAQCLGYGQVSGEGRDRELSGDGDRGNPGFAEEEGRVNKRVRSLIKQIPLFEL